MKKINTSNLIEFLLEQFPKYDVFWQEYLNYWGDDLGTHSKLLSFVQFTVDRIKNDDFIELKQIFDVTESLLCEADEEVQTAIATSFLENLLNMDPVPRENQAYSPIGSKAPRTIQNGVQNPAIRYN